METSLFVKNQVRPEILGTIHLTAANADAGTAVYLKGIRVLKADAENIDIQKAKTVLEQAGVDKKLLNVYKPLQFQDPNLVVTIAYAGGLDLGKIIKNLGYDAIKQGSTLTVVTSIVDKQGFEKSPNFEGATRKIHNKTLDEKEQDLIDRWAIIKKSPERNEYVRARDLHEKNLSKEKNPRKKMDI